MNILYTKFYYQQDLLLVLVTFIKKNFYSNYYYYCYGLDNDYETYDFVVLLLMLMLINN